ncbi:MAG: hypothetical protein F6K26_15330 [Moorea sp. SIO2I5]|nr:hypothetical protein [Moorena sp. SIO2I5]
MLNIDNQFQDLDDIPALKELSDETAAACSGGVSLVAYEHANFRGFKKHFGKYGKRLNVRWVGGSINDKLSSFKLYDGSRSWFKVTLFEHKNFKGKRETFTVRANRGLPFVGKFMNDKISSFKVGPA